MGIGIGADAGKPVEGGAIGAWATGVLSEPTAPGGLGRRMGSI